MCMPWKFSTQLVKLPKKLLLNDKLFTRLPDPTDQIVSHCVTTHLSKARDTMVSWRNNFASIPKIFIN